MTSILLAAALLAPSVGDYFPLVPGTKWYYEEKVGRMATMQQDEVLEPVLVGGSPAYPITSALNGSVFDTLYYRIDSSTVWLVAHDPKEPLDLPVPVLKLDTGRLKWEHIGPTMLANEPSPMTMKCESAPKGLRDVLGTKRETLELKVDAMVGGTGTGIRNVQTSIYAKGVGLVHMRGEGKVGKTTTKFERTLVKFEMGGGGSR